MVTQGHDPVLGIITNDRRAVFQRNIITGVTDLAEKKGFTVIVDSVAEDPLHPRPISLDLTGLAGLLVIANVLSDATLREIYATGLPISLISHYLRDAPIPAIISDNTLGIAQLVDYLVNRCGCQKIVFIQGNMEQKDGIKRDLAFRQELIRHDLEISDDFFLVGGFVPEKARANLAQFLQTAPDFDAVLASDYLMAVAAIDVLTEHGFSVPEDVCVVGFGDGPEAIERGLTTVGADVIEVGRRGARQLIGQIEGLHIRGLTVLSTVLVERATCFPKVAT